MKLTIFQISLEGCDIAPAIHEFFLDGDDLEGNAEVDTFQWWDNLETYGKFGASRFENEFEGSLCLIAESTF